jgi:hypothetical protein
MFTDKYIGNALKTEKKVSDFASYHGPLCTGAKFLGVF